ncbi:hypothetical protein L1987_48221 [Smallanthus sonchifolius]|uniref:Uncharacterized protein n=1 Tax=Smallanthus sonchifolius TaxID=185202 RepID=A0ACB9FRV1_9ASTR|nr:hypothetical protein L1987_48221 [Smallanthus sonchifolius]
MPYAVFEKLKLGEPKPTRISIQLADRSVKYPRAKALTDVCTGKLTLRVNNEEITFDIGQSMKHPQHHDDSLYFIDVCDSIVSCHLHKSREEETCNTQLIEETFLDNSYVEEEVLNIESQENSSPSCEVIDQDSEPKAKPSIKEPPVLDQKELPLHLEYAFLEEKSQLHVIMSSSLTGNEKAKLHKVLKAHKRAIAWKIMDIKGINPSFCTHKILMEDDFKPVVQHQRRLNPNMQEVVKKEVIKLIDAGLIYPISDSPWVSPVQVVQKKG